MRGGDTLYIFVLLLLILFLEVIKVNVKKCDRCGGEFIEFCDAYNTKNYTMQKRSGMFWANVDLCPRCDEDFVAFMKNRDMVPIYYKHLEEEEFGVE